MVDKADNPINSGVHTGCVDDTLVSMDLSEEERSKLLQVMAKAKVIYNSTSPPTRASWPKYCHGVITFVAFCNAVSLLVGI